MRDLPRLPTAGDLHDLARRRFLEGERIRVEELASDLGVSRATAYRWAKNADALVGEVIASLGEEIFRGCVERARGQGGARVLDVMTRGMRAVASAKPYRAFLESDPQRALRVVASKEGAPQRRTIALHQELLEEEVRHGNLHLPVDARTMAYALVRIAESFLYADVIAGEEPDLEKAAAVLKVMLRI